MSEPIPVAIVDDHRFDGHRSSRPHPERPERLLAARQGLAAADARRLRPLAFEPASRSILATVHDGAYVTALERAFGHWSQLDPDTYLCPESADAALAAAGAAVAMAEHLDATGPARGLALLRPPGHHALRARAMGFCVFNNVALAAARLRSRGRRVAIVDWDVHHGNGTQAIFSSSPDVLFISIHQYPHFPGTGRFDEVGEARGTTANLAMPAGCGPSEYSYAFREVVLPLLHAFAPDVVLVSAGFDAHQRDPLADMNLDARSFGALSTSVLQFQRVALFLEGGYDLQAIEESVGHVARSLCGEPYVMSEDPASSEGREAVVRTREALRAYWPGVWPK